MEARARKSSVGSSGPIERHTVTPGRGGAGSSDRTFVRPVWRHVTRVRRWPRVSTTRTPSNAATAPTTIRYPLPSMPRSGDAAVWNCAAAGSHRTAVARPRGRGRGRHRRRSKYHPHGRATPLRRRPAHYPRVPSERFRVGMRVDIPPSAAARPTR